MIDYLALQLRRHETKVVAFAWLGGVDASEKRFNQISWKVGRAVCRTLL